MDNLIAIHYMRCWQMAVFNRLSELPYNRLLPTKTYMICFWGIKTLSKQVKALVFGEF